ncbi:MAG: family 2A encapsulin nanocompartment cargo protein cysteine desulfurase [Anaerovoracaceae bacterium]
MIIDNNFCHVGFLNTVNMQKPFDVHQVRKDFPILREKINGRNLIWLDNAATTQKPQAVINRLCHFYQHENSNIHRAAHTLAARATDAYEEAREMVSGFIHAMHEDEIIFVRGTTEAINLIAQTYGKKNIRAGDEILVSHLEHHANIVPWQMLCHLTGARLRVIPVDDSGQIILDEYEKLINSRTKLVTVAHVSNALGTITPIKEIIEIAHRNGARVLVDGAQGISHLPMNVREWDCDFFVFSGHKIYGPTGIGVAYVKSELLGDMPPYQGGGNMIADVTFERTLFKDPPDKFEAGTGNIADAVGLGAALAYVQRLGIEKIAEYEHFLLEYATEKLRSVPGLTIIGTAKDKTSILSFIMDGFTNEEIGKVLNQKGVAVRTGHHCAQPILRRFGVEGTIRLSLALYNTTKEIDETVRILKAIQKRSKKFYLQSNPFMVY